MGVQDFPATRTRRVTDRSLQRELRRLRLAADSPSSAVQLQKETQVSLVKTILKASVDEGLPSYCLPESPLVYFSSLILFVMFVGTSMICCIIPAIVSVLAFFF